jgi:hypothetical protein
MLLVSAQLYIVKEIINRKIKIMPLQKTEKLISGTGLFANLLNKPFEIGMVLYKDDNKFTIWGKLEDLIPGFSLNGKVTKASSANLNFNTQSGIEITIGANATSVPVAGQVQVKFTKNKSGLIVLKNVVTETLNLGLVQDDVQTLWNERGFDRAGNRRKYVLITSLLKAESGSIIYTEDKNNTVILKANSNKPLSSLAIVGEANVEYVINTKATVELFSTNSFVPLYGAHRLRAGGSFEDIS